MEVTKCKHMAQNPDQKHVRVKAQNAGTVFDLCMKCFEIWDGHRMPNPRQSLAYNIYQSLDPNLPKKEWKRVNEKPIPNTGEKMQYRHSGGEAGATYYYYITTVNALGFESEGSEIMSPGQKPLDIDIIQ